MARAKVRGRGMLCEVLLLSVFFTAACLGAWLIPGQTKDKQINTQNGVWLLWWARPRIIVALSLFFIFVLFSIFISILKIKMAVFYFFFKLR